MAPSKFFTGGPLSTHQLASILNKYSKYDVKIFYSPKVKINPVHNEFKKFKLSHTFNIIDSEKNFLVIPEHYPALNQALQFKYFTQLCSWLFTKINVEATWGKYFCY